MTGELIESGLFEFLVFWTNESRLTDVLVSYSARQPTEPGWAARLIVTRCRQLAFRDHGRGFFTASHFEVRFRDLVAIVVLGQVSKELGVCDAVDVVDE